VRGQVGRSFCPIALYSTTLSQERLSGIATKGRPKFFVRLRTATGCGWSATAMRFQRNQNGIHSFWYIDLEGF
jgi:hypothetical protein